jgi:leader peptidase (prepilin peptidase) / N-methyltransferase
LLGTVVTALPYFIAAVAVKRSGFVIGGGDIKLMAGCGFVLGVWGGIVQSIVALTAVVVIGAVVAAVKKKKYRDVRIPLAPCFGVGGVLAYLAVFTAAI